MRVTTRTQPHIYYDEIRTMYVWVVTGKNFPAICSERQYATAETAKRAGERFVQETLKLELA